MAKLPPANDATPDELVSAMGRQARRKIVPLEPRLTRSAYRDLFGHSIRGGIRRAYRRVSGDVELLDEEIDRILWKNGDGQGSED